MSNFSEVEAKFLLTSFPKSCTSPETWNDLMKETCWSFNSLVKGVGPTHDSSEKPLKKGSPFYEKSGQPLATGHKAATSAIQGDADFFSNHLLLPHWASHFPCTERNCRQSEACPSKCFKTIEMEKQTFVTVKLWPAEKPPSKHPLFHQIPGVPTKFVRGDALHILCCHSIYSHRLGSTMHYLIYDDGPSRQEVAPQQRVSLLWEVCRKNTKL